MHSKIFKKMVSFVLCSVLVFTSVMFSSSSSQNVKADLVSQKQAEINDLNKKQVELKNRMAKMEDKVEQEEARAEILKEKISVLQRQIDLKNQLLSQINSEIAKSEAEIKELENKIESQKDLLKVRLRAIYMSGPSNDLELLFSSQSLTDYLMKSELVRGATDHDKKLMDDMSDSIKSIEKEKKSNESRKSSVSAIKQSLVSNQNELDADYNAARNAQYKADSAKDSLASEIKETQKEIQERQKAIDDARRQAQQTDGTRVLSSMDFAWPVPGHYTISCAYGQQSYRFHTGTDISGGGIYGKPILAIADGKVMTAKYMSYSYGNHMIINHGSLKGNQYMSLYAHCSSLAVSPGQVVKKGQVIGYVGSTGNSTGPHLHLEVRVNGSTVNPMQYFSRF